MGDSERGRPIKLDTLDPQSLSHLGSSIERELARLNQSVQILSDTAAQWHKSGVSVEEILTAEEGVPMLVPLTESLYVAGSVQHAGKLLVDIGAGYYCERTCVEASEYCQRRIQIVKEKLNQIGEEMEVKQKALRQINGLLRVKLQAATEDATQKDMSSLQLAS